MLAQLLSSKPKTNVVNLFLAHPQRSFSFTELRVTSKCPSKLLKVTLKELVKMDFLNLTQKNRVTYYQMNRHFALYPELLGVLRELKSLPKDLLAAQAAKASECKLVVVTGVFVGKPRLETDLLFVGHISPARLKSLIALAEKFAEQEVNYSVFTAQEYDYRIVMNDRFIKNIMENNPLILVDKTKRKPTAKNYKF